MNTKISAILALASISMLCGACATQSATEDDFGRAVRTVMTNQTYDPASRSYPSEEAVTGGNADRLEKVVDAHSGSVSDAQTVARPLSVGTGTQ